MQENGPSCFLSMSLALSCSSSGWDLAQVLHLLLLSIVAPKAGCFDCDQMKLLIAGIGREFGGSVSLVYIDVAYPEVRFMSRPQGE